MSRRSRSSPGWARPPLRGRGPRRVSSTPSFTQFVPGSRAAGPGAHRALRAGRQPDGPRGHGPRSSPATSWCSRCPSRAGRAGRRPPGDPGQGSRAPPRCWSTRRCATSRSCASPACHLGALRADPRRHQVRGGRDRRARSVGGPGSSRATPSCSTPTARPSSTRARLEEVLDVVARARGEGERCQAPEAAWPARSPTTSTACAPAWRARG